VDEVIKLHNPHMTHEAVRDRTIDMLKLVGMANPEGVYRMYPHELSGGMRQRIMIAMALACDPELIIADEPTTALDVTIQAQILDLLKNLKNKIGSSIMLITHDLGVVADMADYVVVMYAGRVVEKGTSQDIFHDPKHPYTIGLMKSKPVVGRKTEELYNIQGSVPNPVNMPDYCYFRDRCEFCFEACMESKYPPEYKISDTHYVSCYRYRDQGAIASTPRSVNVKEL
jgi:peptide/nickel transport system ATP-binding protein